MKYPLMITEVPHRGKANSWRLEDEKHLNELLNSGQVCRSGYFDWCGVNGYDGDAAFTVDAYLDWLRHDLSRLEVIEAEEI